MTKVQKIILNYAAIVIALFSYVGLKTYSDFHYLQIVQRSFLLLIFLSGLALVINNLKENKRKVFTVLFISLGVALVVYSGFVLYLIFALRNIGF